jgi:hypothetical protein
LPKKTPIKKKNPTQKTPAGIRASKPKGVAKLREETPSKTKNKAPTKKSVKGGAAKATVAKAVLKPSASKKIPIKRSSAIAVTPKKIASKIPKPVKKPTPLRIKPKVPFSFTLPVTGVQKRESHFIWTTQFLQEVKEKIHWVNNVVERLDEYEDYEAMQTFFEALFDLRRTIDGKLKLFRQNEAKKELEKIFSL